MAHSLSFLLSSEAASARAERNPNFVVHLEVANAAFNKNCMTELDATDLAHANNIARDWLIHGRAHSVGIRKVGRDGSISGDVMILDLSDFEDEYDRLEAQKQLDRMMADYGLVG